MAAAAPAVLTSLGEPDSDRPRAGDCRWLSALAHIIYKAGYGARKVYVSTRDYRESGDLTIVEHADGWRTHHRVPYRLVEDRDWAAILQILDMKHLSFAIREHDVIRKGT